MKKQQLLLVYWEPFALSAEVFDENGTIVQTNSVLISSEKKAPELFEELYQHLKLKEVIESSLLIRHTNLKLNQFTLPFLTPKEKRNFIKGHVKKEWNSSKEYHSSFYNLILPEGKKDSVFTFTLDSLYIDEFIRLSRKNNILPLKAIPTHALALFNSSVKTSPGEDNILIYDDDDALLVVLASNGKPVIIREMPYTSFLDRKEEFDRLSREIQRTWLYGKQQFKFSPKQIVFCGEELYENRDILCSLLDELSYKLDSKQNWVQDLQLSSVSESYNLIPIRIQQIQSTLRKALFTFIVSSLCFISMLIWNLYLHSVDFALADKIKVEKIVEKSTEILTKISNKQVVLESINKSKDQQTLVKTYSNQPIPAWLMIYFSEHIPDNLVLTDTKVIRDSLPGVWHIDIFGKSPRDPIEAAKLLAEFENNATEDFGRLNLKIAWKVSWLENLKFGHNSDLNSVNKPFHLSGVLQE